MAQRERGPEVTQHEEQIEAVVIVTLRREPALFVETVASVLRQGSSPGFRIVVVVHGSAYRQSLDVATALARVHAPRIALLRMPAEGASAARNAGLGFARAAWPGCDAFAILDEGDRLGPQTLRRGFQALAAAPEAGWAYGDSDLVGLRGGRSAAGEHSVLQHLTEQVSEATLLLRRAALDARPGFDAALPPGAALWDVQLAAIAAGHGGVHVPEAGLLRRARADATPPAAMAARHPALFAPLAILAREASEAPRLLVASAEQGVFCLDPDAPGTALPRAEALLRLAAGLGSPGAIHAPAILVFGADATVGALRRAGLLRGIIAAAEPLLARHPALAVGVTTPAEGPEVGLRLGPPAADPALLLLRPEALETAAARSPRDGLAVTLPAAPPGGAAAIAEAWAAGLPAARGPAPWRRDLRVPRATAAARAAQAIDAWPLLPLAPDPARRDIAFLLPRFGLGGVERATACLAMALRGRGWRTHLVVPGPGSIAPPPAGAFDSLLLPPVGAAEDDAALAGLLAPMQAVMMTHSPVGLSLAPRLRRLGVVTAAGLHMMEPGPRGTPHEVLAAAASLDLVVCHSARLARWCAAAGIPEDRLLAIANAPGHAADPARIAAARAARRNSPPLPLRALVLGRLDRQKAPERLAAVIAATSGPVAWRVVGRAELDDPPRLPLPIEPPTDEAASLDRLYAWADVLVLASRYEGVPLTVLEAQRMGCIPVAPRIGALEEAVADDEDGVLVADGPDAEVVQRLAGVLLALAADPARLARLSGAAAGRGAARSWDIAADALSAALLRQGAR
jgi:glycosyltransferase involved in cell wall biosynthesis